MLNCTHLVAHFNAPWIACSDTAKDCLLAGLSCAVPCHDVLWGAARHELEMTGIGLALQAMWAANVLDIQKTLHQVCVSAESC
jgi:hypothetical protein